MTRIDLGGLDFRATGSRKSKTIPGSWGPEVKELQTMGGLGGDSIKSNASLVFNKLKNEPENLKQATEVFNKVSWGQIQKTISDVVEEVMKISKEHGISEILDETLKYAEEIKSVLESRFVDLHKKTKQLGLD